MEYTLVKGREEVETEYRLAAITYNLTRVVSVFGLERVKKELKKLQNRLFDLFLHLWSYMGTHSCRISNKLLTLRHLLRPVMKVVGA